MKPRVVQVNVSPGGLPKRPVPATCITAMGLEGDGHRDREHHGGPDRAVCLYSLEAIEALRAEGHQVFPGALGENLTVEGLAWDAVAPGTMIAVGEEAVLQVTKYTSPCVNITTAFAGGDFTRVSQKRHPGWSRVYARVLAPGRVQAGDPVRVLAPGDAAAPGRGAEGAG